MTAYSDKAPDLKIPGARTSKRIRKIPEQGSKKMANTAYLTEGSDLPELSSASNARPRKPAGLKGGPDARRDDPSREFRALNLFDDSDLKKAAACEKRAKELSSVIGEMEDSIHMVRIFLSASEAIEELLVQSRKLLEKCRQLSDPHSRDALAETFAEIKYHIDDIVAQSNFHDQNLAAGEILAGAENEAEYQIFREIPLALTTQALMLPEQKVSFRTDAEVIDMAIRIDQAINMVRTRRAIAETALPVLQTRTKIARERSQYLREASLSLTKQDRAYDEVCEYSERRLACESLGSANQNKRDALPGLPAGKKTNQKAPEIVPENTKPQDRDIELPLPHGESGDLSEIQHLIQDLDVRGEYEELDGLAKELARILGMDSYLTNWFKYEEGETGIFTEVLAGSFGPELKDAAVQSYKNDDEFKDITEKYMSKFEALIAQKVEGSSDHRATIDELLKTGPGKIYATLAKACGRV